MNAHEGVFRWYWRQRIRLTAYGRNAGDVPVDLYKQQMPFPEFRFWEHVRENEQVNSSNTDVPEELRPRVLPVLALNEVFIGECLSATPPSSSPWCLIAFFCYTQPPSVTPFCLYIYLSTYLSTYLSIYLSIHL